MPESLSNLYPVSQLAENQPRVIGRTTTTTAAAIAQTSFSC
jgi:hypothetical protein